MSVLWHREYEGWRRIGHRSPKALCELQVLAGAINQDAVVGLGEADLGDHPRHAIVEIGGGHGDRATAGQRLLQRLAFASGEADHQHAGAGELPGADTGTLGLLLEFELGPEGTAKSDGAFETNLAAHKPHELLRYRGAQPSAAESPSRRLVRLGETVED